MAGTTTNWTDASNWQIQGAGGAWAAAATTPGATDNAIFNGTSTRNVVVNVNSIGAVTIDSGYTGTLLLTSPGGATCKLLTMNGGTFQGSNGLAVLNLPNASNTITAGTFDQVGVYVGNTGSLTGGSLTIDGDITLKNGAHIWASAAAQGGNPNTLNWQSGSIATPAMTYGASSSLIGGSGILLINSNGTLGDANDLNQVRLQNAAGGTLNVFGTPTVSGSFTNAAALSIRSAANLKIQGTATQTAGTTELRSGTLTMTANTGIYSVETGSLIGNGTIAGNLSLGTTANGAVSISPGYAGAEIGTLTITKSLHMISTAASTTIQVFADATFDKIVVQSGRAILNGSLTVSLPQNFQKPLTTSYTFLTAPTFLREDGGVTDFAQKTVNGQGVWMDGGVRVWKVKKSGDTGYMVYVGDSMT